MALTDLGALFLSSGGAPIDWCGELVHLSFDCRIPKRHAMRIRWIDANEAPVQAICMRVIRGVVRDVQREWHDVVLWGDTSPEVVDLEVGKDTDVIVRVWNGWRDPELQTLQAAISSAGMKVAEIPDGWRFSCNDGWHEPAFQNLVFEVTHRPLEISR